MKAHLFICVNERETGESCGQKNAKQLRDEVKSLCTAKQFPKGFVRINNAGCLGRCSEGIAAVIYPKGEWILNLQANQAQDLVALVEKTVKTGE